MSPGALFDVSSNRITIVKTELLRETLQDVKTVALVVALADTLADVELETLINTLETIEEKQAQILIQRLVKLKSEALVDVLIDPLAEEKSKILIKTQIKVKAEKLYDPLANRRKGGDTKRKTGQSEGRGTIRWQSTRGGSDKEKDTDRYGG